jgi:hypothetical protein
MARLIFVNRFFFPDHSATSQILSDLTFHLAAGGRDIHVVTSTQTYTDPKAGGSTHFTDLVLTALQKGRLQQPSRRFAELHRVGISAL